MSPFRQCFVYVWTCILVLAVGARPFVEFGSLKTGSDGTRYAGDSDDPFTGTSIEFYPDGNKRNLYTWITGRKNGLHIVWHEVSGHKKSEIRYTEDLEDGPTMEWHTDGQLKSFGTYQLGKRKGLFLTWHENGQWASADYYEDGQGIGLAVEKAPDGTTLKELLFQSGKFVKPPEPL